MTRLAVAAVYCASLSAAAPLHAAQDLPVHMVVLDPSGAKVPGAQVRVLQADLGNDASAHTVSTDRNGELQLNLPPGEYLLQVRAPGFADVQQRITASGEFRSPVRVRLRIATNAESVDVVSSDDGGENVADGQALVLRGSQLAALSSDPNLLQQQINSLVQTDDGTAPQLRVDGFSNGRLPPKSAIREVRVNQNAYSAQFDQRGNSVVDIFTRPGGEKLEGSVYLSGNANALNAPNPYLPTAPSYHSIFLDANLNGPLGKRTSFFVGSTVNDLQNNAAVIATVVDANFNIVPFSQTVADPLLTRSANVRIDHQFTERNTLTARAEWSGTHQDNAGLESGQLVLPSAAYTADTKTFALQLGNTTLVSPKVVLESRFQYRRTWVRQTPNSIAAAVVVQGGFTGGGSVTQGLRDTQDNYEWQEYASFERGAHFFRAGARYRFTRDSNASTASFNGQYIFPSIAAYQATVRGLAQGQTPAQIRAAGGGASQYNVSAGQPGAVISTGDLGLYFEDEWRVSPNFSLTSGLRYESQFGIPDHNDPAPRLGFTLTVPGRKGTPLFRLRGGVGLFYDRFQAGNILTAARDNGVLQQSYFLQDPDTFPATPLPSALGGNASSIYQIAPGYHSPYVLGEGVTLERALLGGRATLTFTQEHGTHGLLSRNANAPLNGVRPLGGSQNVYQFASLGTSDTSTLAPNFTRRLGTVATLWLSYSLRFRDMAGFGPTSFVSNSYDIAADYGRTPSVTRHRAQLTGTFNLPWNFSGTAYLQVHSSTRFNVTTGQDNNGDSIFNDRPSFATDLSQPSVVRTAIGNFNTAPTAGQRPIPIEYGVAPGLVSLQGQLGREFIFGPQVAAEPAAPGAKPSPPDRFFHCFFGVWVNNAFNHVNRSTPIGQLTSPNFGKSLTLNPEVTQVTSANRVVNLFLSFRF